MGSLIEDLLSLQEPFDEEGCTSYRNEYPIYQLKMQVAIQVADPRRGRADTQVTDFGQLSIGHRRVLGEILSAFQPFIRRTLWEKLKREVHAGSGECCFRPPHLEAFSSAHDRLEKLNGATVRLTEFLAKYGHARSDVAKWLAS